MNQALLPCPPACPPACLAADPINSCGRGCAAGCHARVCQYVKIYVPAAVVSASDWWRVAAIGAVALTLGEKDLAVFNSSYRLLWLANIFNGSLSGTRDKPAGI